MVGRHPVIEYEHLAHRTLGNGANSLTDREMQLAHYIEDDQYQGSKQADGLEGIGEHQRGDAPSVGVEPDEQHHHRHIHDKGYACRVEDKLLEDDTHHVEPDAGAYHLGEQEKPGTRLIRTVA